MVEAWLGGARVGRAHGWVMPGASLAVEKIEMAAAHRSQGHGSAVIEALRARAREAGCSELLFRSVRAGNRGAIKLYRALGAHATPQSEGLLTFVLSPP